MQALQQPAHMSNEAFAAIEAARAAIAPLWAPLEALIGEQRCESFMYMGEIDGIRRYKHTNTRLYINIGPDGQTYRYDAQRNGYTPVPADEAITYAHGLKYAHA
jgi:hypothetical protein